ncbi:hypothetical protein LOTGIDRAFT_158426 [Lottia gigantea]|uniref:Uncharacterized protein n=1 Tax=Lottia gigantea TaxID=225164 RepID=V4B017_LOTGI|nr:hypothetical protein LOTGIDRAFT_158426 [Lottia gigantea]ESO99341.1 hypothetical protein LOTGIDRAFT_158426 [Lottia gigantea]
MHLKRSLYDINHYFSNPNPDLRKSISPIVDKKVLLFNGFRILFSDVYPLFEIKNVDEHIKKLIAREYEVDEADEADDEVDDEDDDEYEESDDEDEESDDEVDDEDDISDDYEENYPPITEQIDELEEEIASGQGITFLSDNNEELLNRLLVILAAMKEGHRSHRQYNEVNCILKRILS